MIKSVPTRLQDDPATLDRRLCGVRGVSRDRFRVGVWRFAAYLNEVILMRLRCRYRYVPPEGKEGEGQLALERGDVVEVIGERNEGGWLEGRRLRDGAEGWFPGNYCCRAAVDGTAADTSRNSASSAGGNGTSPRASLSPRAVPVEPPNDRERQTAEVLRVRLKALSREHDALMRRVDALEAELEETRQRANRRSLEMAQALAEEMHLREVAEQRLREVSEALQSAQRGTTRETDGEAAAGVVPQRARRHGLGTPPPKHAPPPPPPPPHLPADEGESAGGLGHTAGSDNAELDADGNEITESSRRFTSLSVRERIQSVRQRQQQLLHEVGWNEDER